MKTIIKGRFTEGDFVTVNINGKEYTRKVRFDNRSKDLIITVNNQHHYFSEFEFKENITMTNEERLIQFIEDELNINNRYSNASAFILRYEPTTDVQVVFNRNHYELYSKLLRFVSENVGTFMNGMVIIETHPATLATTVRVWG